MNHRAFCLNLLEDSEICEKNCSSYDFCYSIGLIEHFRDKDIEKVINRHFEFCRPGGIVLISFPTPTLKYRICRKCMEAVNKWQFYDEVPIDFSEVEETFFKYGEILEHFCNKKLFLTQYVVVVRKPQK